MFQDHPDYIKTHLDSRTSLPNVAGKHKYAWDPVVLRNPILRKANFLFSLTPVNPHKGILKSTLRGLFQPIPSLPPPALASLTKGSAPLLACVSVLCPLSLDLPNGCPSPLMSLRMVSLFFLFARKTSYSLG